MRYWLVIDLEATTDEGGWPIAEMEIIEIGATLVTEGGKEIDRFQCFVKPLRRPLLTPFCSQLTHISQAQVDTALPFAQRWPHFEQWLAPHAQHLMGWLSWGEYDRRQLEQQWQDDGLRSQLTQSPYHNLKQRFAKARQLKRPIGLNAALRLCGLQFQGQQHRALEDARNTARLLPVVLATLNKRSG